MPLGVFTQNLEPYFYYLDRLLSRLEEEVVRRGFSNVGGVSGIDFTFRDEPALF